MKTVTLSLTMNQVWLIREAVIEYREREIEYKPEFDAPLQEIEDMVLAELIKHKYGGV